MTIQSSILIVKMPFKIQWIKLTIEIEKILISFQSHTDLIPIFSYFIYTNGTIRVSLLPLQCAGWWYAAPIRLVTGG